MDTDLTVALPAQPIVVKPKPAEAEPSTGRALWPTFMRRTLTDEALERAAITPRPTAP